MTTTGAVPRCPRGATARTNLMAARRRPPAWTGRTAGGEAWRGSCTQATARHRTAGKPREGDCRGGPRSQRRGAGGPPSDRPRGGGARTPADSRRPRTPGWAIRGRPRRPPGRRRRRSRRSQDRPIDRQVTKSNATAAGRAAAEGI